MKTEIDYKLKLKIEKVILEVSTDSENFSEEKKEHYLNLLFQDLYPEGFMDRYKLLLKLEVFK